MNITKCINNDSRQRLQTRIWLSLKLTTQLSWDMPVGIYAVTYIAIAIAIAIAIYIYKKYIYNI